MSMAEVIIDGRYVPAGPWAADKIKSQVQHLKASFRTGERHEERTIFGPEGDVADQAEARAQLAAAIGPRVVFHRLILAPGPRYKLQRVADLQHWTRLVLADLGRELGQRLTWVAAVHRNTDHPHVHVLLAGAAERARWPCNGQTAGVHLFRGHYTFLSERAAERAHELWEDNTYKAVGIERVAQ